MGDLSDYAKAPHRGSPGKLSGGIRKARDVHAYQKPQGPTSIGNRGRGLGGDNHGHAGSQGMHGETHSEYGSPGIHGSRNRSGSKR